MEVLMMNTNRSFLVAAFLFFCANAHAGITSISIGGAGNFSGENWAQGSVWSVRAILLDSSLNPIGALSPATTFDTNPQSVVPAIVTVNFDAAAPAGSIIRIYRSTSPFNAGDTNVQFADYSVCPCNAGAVSPTATQRLPDPDFSASGTALPVRLQEFSVD
jgi:hypothetical protein